MALIKAKTNKRHDNVASKQVLEEASKVDQVRMNFDIDKSKRARLKAIAAMNDVDVKVILNELIDVYLDEYNG